MHFALNVTILVVILAGYATAGVAVRRLWFREWTDWEGLLVAVAAAICTGAACSYLLGTFGLLSKWPLLGASILLSAAAMTSLGSGGQLRVGMPSALSVSIALVGVFVALSLWMASVLWYLKIGLGDTDPLWFQMPIAVRFFQDHGLTGINSFDPILFTHLYPNASGAIPHAIGMAVFKTDWLSPLINLGWFGFALLSGTVLGRRAGSGLVGLLSILIVLTIPEFVYGQAGSGKWDAAALGLFVAGVAIALVERTPRAAFLAGLLAGLAVAVKLTVLLPALAVMVGLVVRSPRGERVRLAGLYCSAGAVLGSYWFLRNLFTFGSPLPTSKLPFLPWAGNAMETELQGSLVKWLIGAPGAVIDQVGGKLTSLGPAWPVIVVLVVLGIALGVTSGNSTRRFLGWLTVTVFVVTLFQPATGAGTEDNIIGLGHVRYFAPVITLGLITFGAEVRSRLPRNLGWLVSAGLVGALLWNVVGSPILTRGGETKGPLVALGLMIVIGACWWAARQRSVAPRAATAVLVFSLVLVGGRSLATDYAHARNQSYSHFLTTREPVRIGMLGMTVEFIQFKLFGPNLQNQIDFVGVKGANGAIRPVRTCAELVNLINRGDYDLVYASRNRYSYKDKFVSSPEQGWLDAQPGKFIVKRVHLPYTDGYMNIYRFSKPLNAAYCPG